MKRARTILAALAMLALCAGAGAEVIADGTVDYGPTVTQLAAMGGAVSQVFAQAGAVVQPGDPVASLALQRVYAPCAGTVETLFADEGESATDAVEKYGSAMTLLPESLYTVYVTAEDAYASVRTGLISSGQTVYLKCTRDGSHRGTGRITEIDGELFTVETTGGAFYNGETVYVYMEADYDAVDRIGKGTVVAAESQGVSAEGDVVKLYVDVGDFVEKGQLLMETLGALSEDGEAGEEYLLTADTAGYVKALYVRANDAVERGGLLMEICPPDSLAVTALVGEADVTSVRVGDSATVSIELAEETLRVQGRVEAISYLPETDSTGASGASGATGATGATGASGASGYAVRLSVEADARILPGMAATVTIHGGSD